MKTGPKPNRETTASQVYIGRKLEPGVRAGANTSTEIGAMDVLTTPSRTWYPD